MASDLPVEKQALHVPDLAEMAQALREGLMQTFQTVETEVVDCPDLTEKPWSLAAPGICGDTCLADVGGPPYLIPQPTQEKNRSLRHGRNCKFVWSTWWSGVWCWCCLQSCQRNQLRDDAE
eukprot:scpid56167/ scgid21354/ Ester hydrolase C11orf54 homolog